MWSFTSLGAGHPVSPKDFEPGIDEANQALRHALDLFINDIRLNAGVAVVENVEIGLTVPFRVIVSEASFYDVDDQLLPSFASIHHRNETLTGPGDMQLVARFRLTEADSPLIVDVRAGTSLPIGGTGPNPFALGRDGKSHQHIFFGTGTFDPLVGATAIVPAGPVVFDVDLSAHGALYANEHTYRGPGLFTGRVGAMASTGPWSARLAAELFHEKPAKWAGETAENSGRTDLVAAVDLHFEANDAWSAHLAFKRPFTLAVDGGQVEIPFVASFGVTYRGRLWGAEPVAGATAPESPRPR